jgi:anti-sigma factor RsiW
MRCETSKRMISDALDGVLSGRRAVRLERHLAGCAACRAYRQDAALIQESAGGLADPRLAPAAWGDFGRRLEARLAAASVAAPEPARTGLPVFFRWKWAWAAAAFAVLAFTVTYLGIVRTRTAAEPALVPFEDSLARVLGEAGESPALENSFNEEILASIDETVRSEGTEAPVSFGDNPLFWEALSEGELSYIESALRQEKSLGGVS